MKKVVAGIVLLVALAVAVALSTHTLTLSAVKKHPASFDGKTITVTGVYHWEKEDGSFDTSQNQDRLIWLSFQNDTVRENPPVTQAIFEGTSKATVTGTFRVCPHGCGHLGLWKNEIVVDKIVYKP